MNLFDEYVQHVIATKENPIQVEFLHDYLCSLSPEDRKQVLSYTLAEWDEILVQGKDPKPIGSKI